MFDWISKPRVVSVSFAILNLDFFYFKFRYSIILLWRFILFAQCFALLFCSWKGVAVSELLNVKNTME
jgi:hypothetical protein